MTKINNNLLYCFSVRENAGVTNFKENKTMTNTLSKEALATLAPSIFATEPYHQRSEKYDFIPTIDIIDSLQELGYYPTLAGQSKSRTLDKKNHVKHIVRLRHESNLDNPTQEEVPEIVLTNSHDGTSCYNFMLGFFRFVCSNGLIIQDSSLANLKVKHKGNGNDVLNQVIDASYEVIEAIPEKMKTIETFKQIEVTPEEQEALALTALEFKNSNLIDSIHPQDLLKPRRWQDVKKNSDNNTLWNTYNILQENMLKGGVKGYNYNTKRNVSLRKVSSVDGTVNLNKALWSLTERMAQIKGA